MWIVAWVFVIGLWVDVITTTKIDISLQRAPLIISIGGGILFAIFQTICVLFILKFQPDLMNTIFNVLLALVLLSGCILIPVFGSMLLKKLESFRENKEGITKLIRKTKTIMTSAFIFAALIIVLIIFTVCEITIKPFSPLRYILFQISFRIGEILVLPCVILLCTGNSIKKTFMNCITFKAKDTTSTNTKTAKTQEGETNDSRKNEL